MRIKLLVILLLLYNLIFGQDNPYQLFGQTTKVEYKITLTDLFRVKNIDTTSNLKYVAFDFEKGNIFCVGKNDSVINTLSVEPERLYRFIGIDPIAEKYAFVTPYNYAENSPIANIDLWGLQAKFAADGSFLSWGKITGTFAPVWLDGKEISGINIGQLTNRVHWNYGEGVGAAAQFYVNKVNNIRPDQGEDAKFNEMKITNTDANANYLRCFNGKHPNNGNYNYFTEEITGGLVTGEDGTPVLIDGYYKTKVDHLENINTNPRIQGLFSATLNLFSENPAPDPTLGATSSAGGDASILYAQQNNIPGTRLSVVKSPGGTHVYYQKGKLHENNLSSYFLYNVDSKNNVVNQTIMLPEVIVKPQ